MDAQKQASKVVPVAGCREQLHHQAQSTHPMRVDSSPTASTAQSQRIYGLWHVARGAYSPETAEATLPSSLESNAKFRQPFLNQAARIVQQLFPSKVPRVLLPFQKPQRDDLNTAS